MITTFLAFAVTDLVGVRAVAVPAAASASTSAWALRGWPGDWVESEDGQASLRPLHSHHPPAGLSTGHENLLKVALSSGIRTAGLHDVAGNGQYAHQHCFPFRLHKWPDGVETPPEDGLRSDFQAPQHVEAARTCLECGKGHAGLI